MTAPIIREAVAAAAGAAEPQGHAGTGRLSQVIDEQDKEARTIVALTRFIGASI